MCVTRRRRPLPRSDRRAPFPAPRNPARSHDKFRRGQPELLLQIKRATHFEAWQTSKKGFEQVRKAIRDTKW